nr:shikimate dehydrogenase [uncultured Oscillibacter sp.]
MITTNVKYDTETRLLGLLGHPLDHSITSVVHNAMYQFGDLNAVFIPFELEDAPGALDRFFDAVKTLGILGFSVTMPYKTRMLPYMDEVSEECRAFNCVNNVKYVDGRFFGDGFDGYGMCQAIEDTGARLAGREALIIGAGGISGVIANEMARRGVTAFTILNRTAEKADRLAQILSDRTGLPVRSGPLTREELDRAAGRADVVAQCTSVGMYGTGTQFPYLGFIQKLDKSAIVADALYNPLQTAILKAASERGLQTVNGIGMLANQMNALIRFYFGTDLGLGGKCEATSTIIRAMQDRIKAGKA